MSQRPARVTRLFGARSLENFSGADLEVLLEYIEDLEYDTFDAGMFAKLRALVESADVKYVKLSVDPLRQSRATVTVQPWNGKARTHRALLFDDAVFLATSPQVTPE